MQRLAVLIFLMTIAAFGVSQRAAAQDPWEFSPYKIRLWIAIEPTSGCSTSSVEELGRRIAELANAAVGAPWDLQVETPPVTIATDLAFRLESLTATDFVGVPKVIKKGSSPKPPAAAPETSSAEGTPSATADASPATSADSTATDEGTKTNDTRPANASAPIATEFEPVPRAVLKSDKVLVLAVREHLGGFRLIAREFDCRARAWGPARDAMVSDLGPAPSVAFQLLMQAFSPVARLEVGKEATAQFRLRASGLAVHEDSPILADKDAVLRPFVRYNDRSGEPKPGGVQPVAWTYVTVKDRVEGLLNCDVHTGLIAPLKARNNPRIERFALLTRSMPRNTIMRFRTADKAALPMSGYSVFAKDPRSEDVEEIGRTDWRGLIQLPAGEYPLRVVYVRNGASLLARLPVVPGIEPEMTVDLASDDRRLQAEGYLAGVQTTIMDVVAQRALLEKRIGKHIDDQRFADAEKLLEELRTLKSRDELARSLDQQQPKFTSPHRSVQTKINKLFEDTRKTLNKFLDPSLADRLAKEIADRKQGGPRSPAATPPRPTASAPAPQKKTDEPAAEPAKTE